MGKYIALFMVVVFLVPALAQTPPPATHAKAIAMKTQTNAFIDKYATDLGWDATQQQEAKDNLGAILDNITEDKNLDNFDVSSYMQQLNTKVDAMIGQFDAASGMEALKQEYIGEVAQNFVTEYINDMSQEANTIDTEDYIEALSGLNKYYEGQVQPPAEYENDDVYCFNPEEHLDRASGEGYGVKAQLDFIGDGYYFGQGQGDHYDWFGQNLHALLNAFQSAFAHSAVAQQDFAALEDLWPASVEAYTMNTAYDEGQYYINDPNDPEARQKSYTFDEYGEAMEDGSYNAEDYQLPPGETPATHYTLSANNRSWGYVDGDFALAKISIRRNGQVRQYQLAEHFYTSPLVLDLDGNGKIQASGGVWMPHRYKGGRLVEFDMNGDGFVNLTEWVGPQDGLLIEYTKGKPVDANCLFGNAGGFDHGYEKLSLRDKNNDKQITGAELDGLSVWQDINCNARVDKGEIKTVQEMGITLISLKPTKYFVSHFVINGKKQTMYDWFPTMFTIKKTK
jgi:hypothetical protein